MGKISVLNKHMAELIAAGEVIERPSSVIKELVENSLDAGCKNITVEIQNGGITYMRVTDDGCGIAKEDLPTAFLRHATSKLKEEIDLENISTFGFRGEAFPSIAAMSRVEVLTRTQDSEIGARYVIEGGEEVEFDDAGCQFGTTVIVRDIFFNTPARMKFLKKDVSEGNAIAAVIDRLALANEGVSFKFIRDGKVVLKTPGNSNLYDTIYSVLGQTAAENMMEVNYEFEGVRVRGFVSKPEYSRPSRAMQYTYINSRFVKSNTVMAAVEQAFKGSIMVGKFPAFVLNVSLSFNLVDVNVHPAKIEVRFVNERPIFECVINGVKSAILKNSENKEVVFKPTPKAPTTFFESEETAVQQNIFQKMSAEQFKEAFTPKKEESAPIKMPDFTYREEGYKQKPTHLKSDAVEREFNPPPQEKPQEMVERIPSKVIGELFGTYILVQRDDALVLIDKHAAHERLIYEKLKKENGVISNQMLLMPVVVTLPKDSYCIAVDNLDLFSSVGFEIEDFGNYSVVVRAVPVMLESTDVEPIIFEIVEKISQNKRDVTFEKLDWLYHSVSCRAAIKANDRSTKEELENLVRLLDDDSTVRHCPHGRPIYIQITKKELEKQFGRIV